MRITLIYDNEEYKKGLVADFGFSALIEIKDTPKILFDTGTNGEILLNNMERLSIDINSIGEVFISHTHFDHIGGLSDFLNRNNKVKIFLPVKDREKYNAKEVVFLKERTKIHENVFSTGVLGGIEQALCIKTSKGVVVIVGCSHPGVETILKTSSKFGRMFALIGGLHDFMDFKLLKDLELICPCHCT